MPITTKVPVSVDATLEVAFDHPEHPNRDATAEDLKRFGFVNRDGLYRHLSRTLALAATGDADTDLTSQRWRDSVANRLRYLIEVALHYADTPEAVLAHLGDDPWTGTRFAAITADAPADIDPEDPPTAEDYRALLAAIVTDGPAETDPADG